MLKLLLAWNETLLHTILRIPHREHTEPGAPLSAILRSHPPVAVHRHLVPLQHRTAHQEHASLQAQIERERQRQPRILKGWQRRIGAEFERRIAD